jgi:hypothetical protein
MNVITKTEAANWCRARHVLLDKRERPEMPDDAERFDIPEDAGRRVALVASHFNERAFGPTTLVWFADWSVWPSGERPHIFDRFRASYGERRSLIDAPAHLLAVEEREELLSLVTLGVLFLWDVYVVADDASLALHYSHDEWGWWSRRAAV